MATSTSVKNLLNKMSLEEKVTQLVSISIEELVEGRKISAEKMRSLLRHGVGEITRLAGSRLRFSPREVARMYNEIQRFLVRETRLGIPAIVHEEGLVGLMAPTATVFPIPLALASSWDPDLVHRVATAIREQSMVIGSRQILAPVLDLCREPRWGRCEETYGEDPYLVASMGVAYIKGLQGDDIRQGVVATAKHFAGHGVPEGGRNTAPVHVGEREFRETHLYPFEAAVKEAKVLSVMAAYHEIDGVPCHANKWLLTEVLRNEWGFEGMVVSDYFAVKQLNEIHKVARTCLEAALRAIDAGVDVELPHAECYPHLIEAVKKGLIDEEVINRAVERVLKIKYALGLFDNPYVDEARVPEKLDSDRYRELAREAARRSIVLLKNSGVLPITRDVKTIAVVGPNADDPWAMLGDYHYDSHVGAFAGWYGKELSVDVVTVLEGIKRVAGARGVNVLYAKGCDVHSTDTSGFGQALDVAKKADVVVAVMGDRSGLFNTKMFTSGEGVDRASLRLPGVQEELIKELAGLGKPVVLVLINGRPLALSGVADQVSAIVEAWRPGEEGGAAIAEVLFGDYNPGGCLPVSLPYDVGQVPVYYSRKPGGLRHERYVEYPFKPLFPFGYGLSYTKFTYEQLSVEPSEVRSTEDTIRVSVRVRNIGERTGDDVVQLYISRSYASVTRPLKELKGFKRITLRPGEAEEVVFEVPLELLAYYDRNMKLVVEPGEYEVMIGRNAEEVVLKERVSVVGDVKVFGSRRRFFSKAYVVV